MEAFGEEIAALSDLENLRPSSKILSLHPFLDDKGLLRVGGRLRYASLFFSRKHSILLSTSHAFTRLMIEWEHKRLLHTGLQALLAAIHQRYWPLRGRNINQVFRSCVWCSRKNQRSILQLMGDLPIDRVTPMRPFFSCGVDFVGPIITLLSKERRPKTIKSYISLFVCFTTKAIHLSDLSTKAFLAALGRFIGRRGPQRIYSVVMNFKNAQREINEMYAFLQQQVKRLL